MNRILLTTTALVAFAGAAAADGHTSVSHSLGGTLGYNSEVDGIGEDGFFWEGNLKTTATAALDNGVTAGAYFEVTVNEDTAASGGDDDGISLGASDFVLSVTSDTASLYFGDTAPAGKKHFSAAGDMEADSFSTDSDSNVLRGDVSFGMMNGSISYIIDDAANTAEQLAVGASGSFGAFTVGFGYQEDTTFADAEGDFNADEIYGASVKATFFGANITGAYAENSTDDAQSAGIKVAYPFGPVTATGYYVMETAGGADLDPNYGVNVAYANGPISISADYQDDQGTAKYFVEGSYDIGNGLTALAGALNENEGDEVDFYVGGKYDLGGGASVLAVYAADEDGDQGDEIASGEYDPGITVEVSFAF